MSLISKEEWLHTGKAIEEEYLRGTQECSLAAKLRIRARRNESHHNQTQLFYSICIGKPFSKKLKAFWSGQLQWLLAF